MQIEHDEHKQKHNDEQNEMKREKKCVAKLRNK